MKIVAQIARYLVGVVFIFSGLIKLNDPVGTQIKLEEYFEVFAADLPAFHDLFIGLVPVSLYISVFLCTAEVVLGFALIFGYKPRITSWLLLLIVIFFTFLTFYSAYFNKVTDCGCFGDAIKLKPWTSFSKDLVLLILISLILYKRNSFKALPTGLLIALVTTASLGIAVYAIRHLPPLDLLPYRVGASIPEQMKPSAAFRYSYKFEKDGKEYSFEQYPSDTTLQFVSMTLLNEDAKPKITDYKIWNNEGDFTEMTFQGKKLLVIIKNLTDINMAAFPSIRKLVGELGSLGVEPVIVTSAASDDIEPFLKSQQLDGIPYYFGDGTVLKTISRSNPGILLLDRGRVKGKWHYNDTPDIKTLKNSLSQKFILITPN